jgi:hypothetical protein
MIPDMSDTEDVDIAPAGQRKISAKPRWWQPDASADGVETTWSITPATDNLDPKYYAQKSTAKLEKVKVKGKDGKWTNTVTFPHIGNETFTVKALVPSQMLEREFHLRTVRTIPASVYYVSDAAKTVFAGALPTIAIAFAKAGIKLDLKTPWKKTDVGGLQFSKGVDKDFTPRKDLKKLFTGETLPAVDPPKGHLRILVVEQLEFLRDAANEVTLTRAQALQAADAEQSVEVTDWQHPLTSVRSGTWTAGGDTVDISGQMTPDEGQLKVRLTRAQAEKVARGKTGKVKFNVEFRERGFLGWYEDGVLFVGTKDKDEITLASPMVAKLAMHELGHAFGLTPATRWVQRPSKKKDPLYITYYVGHGGTGPHCSMGAMEDDEGDMVWDPDGGTELCVMYHDAKADHVRSEFCEECVLNLRLAYLRNDTKTRKRWT